MVFICTARLTADFDAVRSLWAGDLPVSMKDAARSKHKSAVASDAAAHEALHREEEARDSQDHGQGDMATTGSSSSSSSSSSQALRRLRSHVGSRNEAPPFEKRAVAAKNAPPPEVSAVNTAWVNRVYNHDVALFHEQCGEEEGGGGG